MCQTEFNNFCLFFFDRQRQELDRVFVVLGHFREDTPAEITTHINENALTLASRRPSRTGGAGRTGGPSWTGVRSRLSLMRGFHRLAKRTRRWQALSKGTVGAKGRANK